MNQIVLTIIFVIASVIVTVFFMSVFTVAKRSDTDIDELVGEALNIYGLPQTLSQSLKPYLPEKYKALCDEVFSSAEKAVLNTSKEKTNQIVNAKALVCGDLKVKEIELDETVNYLVDTAVLALITAVKNQ